MTKFYQLLELTFYPFALPCAVLVRPWYLLCVSRTRWSPRRGRICSRAPPVQVQPRGLSDGTCSYQRHHHRAASPWPQLPPPPRRRFVPALPRNGRFVPSPPGLVVYFRPDPDSCPEIETGRWVWANSRSDSEFCSNDQRAPSCPAVRTRAFAVHPRPTRSIPVPPSPSQQVYHEVKKMVRELGCFTVWAFSGLLSEFLGFGGLGEFHGEFFDERFKT